MASEEENFFSFTNNKRTVFCKDFPASVFQCGSLDDLTGLIKEAKRLYSADLKAPFIGNALWLAVKENRRDVISCFIKEGADINMWFKGRTLLHYAVKLNSQSKVKFLLSLPGINKDAPDFRGMTPLVFAATGSPTCLKVLLDAGCDITTRDNEGNPALHQVAEMCGDDLEDEVTSCLHILLSHGVDIDERCARGKTCLQTAVDQQLYSMVAWLLYHNADLNAAGGMESLPYINCCQRRPLYDLNLDLVDHCHFFTPLFLAVFMGNGPTIDVLISCGATFRPFGEVLKACSPGDSTRQKLETHLASPTSLKSLCRTVIRGRLSWRMSQDVCQLGLPKPLQRFVLCSDNILAFRKAVRYWGRLLTRLV